MVGKGKGGHIGEVGRTQIRKIDEGGWTLYFWPEILYLMSMNP